MLIVHHIETSRSHRILWLLEELAVPYEIRLYRRDPAPAELKKIHPLGKSPVVTDGDTVVAESGAIIEYLGNALVLRHRPSCPIWSRHRARPSIAHAASGCITRRAR